MYQVSKFDKVKIVSICVHFWDGSDTLGEYNGAWGDCRTETCKGRVNKEVERSKGLTILHLETRPILCYQKFAFDVKEAELLYCRYHEDLCVYAYLQHEDGKSFYN